MSYAVVPTFGPFPALKMLCDVFPAPAKMSYDVPAFGPFPALKILYDVFPAFGPFPALKILYDVFPAFGPFPALKMYGIFPALRCHTRCLPSF